jgi:dihydrofolate synthase/folylpolyglutamate synthase
VPGGWLVLDGAHNPGAAQALADSLRACFGQAPVTLVLGVSGDKDARAILAALAPVARRLILTRAGSPRAAPPEALRALVPAPGPEVSVVPSADEALALGAAATETPILCVAGSLFLVGDVLRTLAGGDKPCSIEKGADSIESLF